MFIYMNNKKTSLCYSIVRLMHASSVATLLHFSW